MFIILLILSFQLTVIQANVDCSTSESSCIKCLLSNPDCFWCSSSTENKCQPFMSNRLSQFFCADNWIHSANGHCPADLDNNVQENDKLDKMLELLEHLKAGNSQKHQQQSQNLPQSSQLQQLLQQHQQQQQSSSSLSQNTEEGTTTTTSSADLKELLHKLLLLKLLRKVKNQGSATLSDEDKLLLLEISSKASTTITTTKAPVTDMNNEISQLISILQEEARKKSKNLINKIRTPNTTQEAFAKTILLETTTKPTVKVVENVNKSTSQPAVKLNNHVEKVDINYEETEGESLPSVTNRKHLKNKTVTVGKANIAGYCSLYERMSICNQDNNCTWCNPADECIHSNDQDYDVCVHTKRNGYDIDPCFTSKHCKQCVQDDKCYWCDVSKSCHTYPFVGYVPTACGGDWYVKQCDVQLAVIVIVLPLIMILLAMVTFYFCLKYCYYRRKVLRVPLFEKPGVFDYRKDKKVYFVHPDDESSDNEMETEKLRKKYRLPLERAPLIDPNS